MGLLTLSSVLCYSLMAGSGEWTDSVVFNILSSSSLLLAVRVKWTRNSVLPSAPLRGDSIHPLLLNPKFSTPLIILSRTYATKLNQYQAVNNQNINWIQWLIDQVPLFSNFIIMLHYHEADELTISETASYEGAYTRPRLGLKNNYDLTRRWKIKGILVLF